jgi:hypothetical protein
MMLSILLYLTLGKSRLSDKISSLESVVSEKNSRIKYFESENGRLISEKEAATVRASELEKMYPEVYKKLSSEMNIKVKDLKAYIESSFKSSGSGSGTITNNYYTTPSGIKRHGVFKASDGYLDIKADLIDSLNSPYTYTYTDTISQSISTKKKWFLGNERLYGTATMSNPRAIITGSNNILIDNYRDKRWGFGIVMTYDFGSSRFIPGLGISYNLIKF